MYVYGDITTDARVQRAGNALSEYYDVTVISNQHNKPLPSTTYKNILVGEDGYSLVSYFRTIKNARRIIKTECPDILYGHDYYSALLLKLFLRRKYVSKIVYDAHELYIPERNKPFSIRSRIFYWIEKSIVRDVDLLICASSERAKRMQFHYNLQHCPTVIRNISQLKISPDSIPAQVKPALDAFFSIEGTTVVYAGVVVNSRRLTELVKAVSKLAPKYKLLVVGGGSAFQELREMAGNVPMLKSLFTGPLPYTSLGAILSRCDVGFIYYPVDTLNNIYCASNKLYEYASVSLPILSNLNPTIQKELDTYHIGIANDDFEEGLSIILSQLGYFKSNCDAFNRQNSWREERIKLQQSINLLF